MQLFYRKNFFTVVRQAVAGGHLIPESGMRSWPAIAVGTGTCVLAAVIPKYLSQRLIRGARLSRECFERDTHL